MCGKLYEVPGTLHAKPSVIKIYPCINRKSYQFCRPLPYLCYTPTF